MKLLLSFVLALTCAHAAFINNPDNQEWEEYKIKFSKIYKNSEAERISKHLYFETKKELDEHNKKYAQGLVTFEVGINHFSDMLVEEIMSMHNSLPSEDEDADFVLQGVATSKHSLTANSLPKSIDWREKGAVTAVKNQGQCGSCWAFSTIASVESHNFLTTGKLVSLSEQNLLDCAITPPYNAHGCHGGSVRKGFEYIIHNGGIDKENLYPYQIKQNDKCKYSGIHSGAKVVNFTALPRFNEEKLQEVVGTIGPVSVGIDATGKLFHHYKSGVFFNPDCSQTKLDHDVLAVGYGTDSKGQDYWIVKNSWGEHFGMKGYIYMARNRNNHCGIATKPLYPHIEK